MRSGPSTGPLLSSMAHEVSSKAAEEPFQEALCVVKSYSGAAPGGWKLEASMHPRLFLPLSAPRQLPIVKLSFFSNHLVERVIIWLGQLAA